LKESINLPIDRIIRLATGTCALCIRFVYRYTRVYRDSKRKNV